MCTKAHTYFQVFYAFMFKYGTIICILNGTDAVNYCGD